jgi:hypothetical protein
MRKCPRLLPLLDLVSGLMQPKAQFFPRIRTSGLGPLIVTVLAGDFPFPVLLPCREVLFPAAIEASRSSEGDLALILLAIFPLESERRVLEVFVFFFTTAWKVKVDKGNFLSSVCKVIFCFFK